MQMEQHQLNPENYLDKEAIKTVQNQQAQILTQIGEFKTIIDEAREKWGPGGMGELKESVNKMATDFRDSVEASNKLHDDAAKRVSDLEEELKKLTGEGDDHWNPNSPGPADAFMVVYGDLCKAANVENFVGASQLDVENAIKAYGFNGSEKYNDFDFRAVMFPERYQKKITALGGPDIAEAAGQAGALLTPQYIAQPLAPAQEMNTISDAFPVFNMMGEKLIWREERLSVRAAYRDNNPTTGRVASRQSLDFTGTGQGNIGGVMEMAWDQKSVESRTFLATAQASVQILDDAPYVREQILEQLEYEQQRTVDTDILYGTNAAVSGGSATLFDGINRASVNFNNSLLGDVRSSRTQLVDVLRVAWLQSVLTFVSPDRHFLHPIEYTAISLLKANDGDYLFPSMKEDSTTGNKTGPMGMPITCSTYVNKDNFFTYPTRTARLGVKKGWSADVSLENKDNVERLEVTFRVYGRYAFIQFRPNSGVKGVFSNILAS